MQGEMEKSTNCFCSEKTTVRKSANNKRHKDYYLKDVMQFILPFMKVKTQSSNLTIKDTEDKDEQNSDIDINVDDSDVSLQDEIPSTPKAVVGSSALIVATLQ
ncbi:unnamed protein product [Macrosiphum euphorbiae]|uniref:Uncharacterized protein n=1 Tax=Macrosiphum euphorbiae TaxID=13131 RepID=A0AAV0WGC1_9HEMI|nr:unnamed protein product [Macrosiphum euphorbiae]